MGIPLGPEHPASAGAVEALTSAVTDLGREVARLPERLEKLEKREGRNLRLIRILVAAVAVLALLLAVLAVVFVVQERSQDAARAEFRQRRDAQIATIQAQNVRFRVGMCSASRDWEAYLGDAPPGGPAGQAAARHLIQVFRSLCGR